MVKLDRGIGLVQATATTVLMMIGVGPFLTIPFMLYGIFRYLYLIHHRQLGGSPEEVLFSDRPLIATIALWGLTVAGILMWFRNA